MTKCVIRPLEDRSERKACVALQKRTWGADFEDIVPAALMHVSAEIGGVSAGAFNPDGGSLAGIIFGLAGYRGDTRVHWSHMLAVEPPHRGRGLGRALKIYQRQVARRRGASLMYWTFDPLEARNAHFNLNRLRVCVDEYVRDMYGSGESSPLHRGLGTDRFVVRWDLEAEAIEEAIAPDLDRFAWREETAIVRLPLERRPSTPAKMDVPRQRPRVTDQDRGLVEIPPDIQQLKVSDPRAAADWRTYSRSAITTFLNRGYRISSFWRDEQTGRSFYVFDRM